MIADAATVLVYFGLVLVTFAGAGALAELLLLRGRDTDDDGDGPAGPAAPLNNGTIPASSPPRSSGGGAARRAGTPGSGSHPAHGGEDAPSPERRRARLEHDGPADNWGAW